MFVAFAIGIGFVMFQFEFSPNDMLVGSKGFESCENTIGAIAGSVDGDDGDIDGYLNEVDDSRSDDEEVDDSVDDSMDSGRGEHTTKLKKCTLMEIC